MTINEQSLNALDTDGTSIDSVRLGAMGIETGTRGTVFIDDYQSRRFSKIGPLPDPGVHDIIPTLDETWVSKANSYVDNNHKHAVTSMDVVDAEDVQTTNTYEYDTTGRDICTLKRSDRET